MTLSQFHVLPPEMQLRHVLAHGHYLAQRCEQGSRMNLYYLPNQYCGFFAEIGIDEEQEEFRVLRSFRHSALLEAYVSGLQLPDGWA
jgi:hypothetical protein